MRELSLLPLATISAVGFYIVVLAMFTPWFRKAFDAYTQDGNRHALKGFDLLRGLAATAVAAGHGIWFSQPLFNKTLAVLPQLDYASKAVGVFATLSGFLIYRSLATANTIDGIKKYAVKRFFRIYPIYFACVLFCAVMSQYSKKSTAFDWMYFFNDITMYRLYPIGTGANPVFWTLYVEVLFYIALPIVLLTVRKRYMWLACTVILAWLIGVEHGDRYIGLCKYFCFGVLASELSTRLKKYNLPIFLSGIALCLYDFGGPDFDWVAGLQIGSKHPFLDTVGLGIGCGLLLASLPNLSTIGKLMDAFPFRFLGTISYSIYLVHLPYLLCILPSLGLLRIVHVPCEQAVEIGSTYAWYLPLVFLPGVLFWSFVAYMFIERPGILLGRLLLKSKKVAASPVQTKETREPAPV